MDDDLEIAEELRAKAEAARQKANGFTDRKMRVILLETADDYENMARTMEAIHRSKEVLARLQNSN